jgi:hypothetical protein
MEFFYFLRWIFRLFRNIFDAFPKLGVAFGVLLVLFSFYVAVSGFKDNTRYSNEPLTLSIVSATTQTPDDGLFVSLTDAQIHYEQKVKLKKNPWLTFVPITDPQKKVLILVACDERQNEVASLSTNKQLTGVLKPMSQFDDSGVMQGLQANGFDASKFVPKGAPVYQLCISCKDNTGKNKLILAVAFAISGVAIFYCYYDKRWKTVQPLPAPVPEANPVENHHCPSCKLINFAEATHCRRCGHSIINCWG